MLCYCILSLRKIQSVNDFMPNTDETLGPKNEKMKVEQLQSSLLARNWKIFEEVENAGTDISYRFNKCWDCKICKEHQQNEIMSIQEEVEQGLINKSVSVNVMQRTTKLFFLSCLNFLGKLAQWNLKLFIGSTR